MKKPVIFFVFLLMVSLPTLVQAQETPLQKDIRKLLEMTGSGEMGIQVAGQLMGSFKQIYPSVPESFWNEFLNSMKAEDLVEMIIPIYERHLSHEDVKNLIAFYETPTGKKFISAMPAINQESMTAGRAYGMKLGEKVVEQLKQKGYLEN